MDFPEYTFIDGYTLRGAPQGYKRPVYTNWDYCQLGELESPIPTPAKDGDDEVVAESDQSEAESDQASDSEKILNFYNFIDRTEEVRNVFPVPTRAPTSNPTVGPVPPPTTQQPTPNPTAVEDAPDPSIPTPKPTGTGKPTTEPTRGPTEPLPTMLPTVYTGPSYCGMCSEVCVGQDGFQCAPYHYCMCIDREVATADEKNKKTVKLWRDIETGTNFLRTNNDVVICKKYSSCCNHFMGRDCDYCPANTPDGREIVDRTHCCAAGGNCEYDSQSCRQVTVQPTMAPTAGRRRLEHPVKMEEEMLVPGRFKQTEPWIEFVEPDKEVLKPMPETGKRTKSKKKKIKRVRWMEGELNDAYCHGLEFEGTHIDGKIEKATVATTNALGGLLLRDDGFFTGKIKNGEFDGKFQGTIMKALLCKGTAEGEQVFGPVTAEEPLVGLFEGTCHRVTLEGEAMPGSMLHGNLEGLLTGSFRGRAGQIGARKKKSDKPTAFTLKAGKSFEGHLVGAYNGVCNEEENYDFSSLG